ncbi:hypothetical protein BDK51DRAFT_29072 [Blyttiomyces helicus]|uniref:Hexosyltransferase n=1 Tax=Blyttiomyces helicus TaxID=388810 RepID=A0A4P9W723_9FUNG|nr:hypothetical protein BDK51DRAFT_29072 [Blyttiomyces helicus]|eukprot:RKO88259.1 hypothetical protein BDK51DRAFT_29072 [Blyttiomyces helicus]
MQRKTRQLLVGTLVLASLLPNKAGAAGTPTPTRVILGLPPHPPLPPGTDINHAIATLRWPNPDLPAHPLVTNCSQAAEPIRLYIGIVTTAKRSDQREFLRATYARFLNVVRRCPGEVVDVFFVVGDPESEEYKMPDKRNRWHVWIGEPPTVNMVPSAPPKLQYLKHVGDTVPRPSIGTYDTYSHVMKTDDDSWVVVDNLLATLRGFPFVDTYYGRMFPAGTIPEIGWNATDVLFMGGMGYVLTWDLILHIKTSDVAATHPSYLLYGEDGFVGYWLHQGGVAKNKYDGRQSLHDYQPVHAQDESLLWISDPMTENSVLVHRLKTVPWMREVAGWWIERAINASIAHPTGGF